MVLDSDIFKKFRVNYRNTVPFQRTYWANAITQYKDKTKLFGYDWGNPEENITKDCENNVLGNYLYIKDNYLIPYIKHSVVLEIGSGGGKWVQYMKLAKKIICVDLSDETLNYIKGKLGWKKLVFYKTVGDELYGIQEASVDFVFSIDSLVRIPKRGLSKYFNEIHRILVPNGKICLHLPCNEVPGSKNRGFTDISIEEIRKLCITHGFKISMIDKQNIEHGVILLANKYVRN